MRVRESPTRSIALAARDSDRFAAECLLPLTAVFLAIFGPFVISQPKKRRVVVVFFFFFFFASPSRFFVFRSMGFARAFS